MSAITVTAAQVSAIDSEQCEIYDGIAGVAITAGQPLYIIAATGKYGICDANDSGKEQFRGVALKTVGAGQALSILKRGRMYGLDLSGLSYDDIVYESDTAGGYDTAAGTKTVRIGRVVPLSDSTPTKVLYVDADYRTNW